jgi:DNA-binding response OmpR family regulator
VEAADGEEALRMMQSESPDAILLDVHLPGQSGIEVLERLKQAGDTCTVIMMTADPQLEDVKAALRLGWRPPAGVWALNSMGLLQGD